MKIEINKQTEANEITWVFIRLKRDMLLSQTDVDCQKLEEQNKLGLIPESQLLNMLEYRQALRDIPQDFENPKDVIFPNLTIS